MSTNIKTGIIAAIVALIVAGGTWLALPAKTPAVGAANFGNTSIDGSQSNLPNPSNFDYLVARLVIGLGTNTSVSATGAGNINIAGQRMLLASGTSTVCAIQNPLNATSSILNVSMNITTATSSAITWGLGTSTTQFATSTSMETAAIAASNQGTITWDPGINNAIIGPGQWFNIGPAAGTAGNTGAFSNGVVLVGSCQITLQSAN